VSWWVARDRDNLNIVV